MEILNTTYLFLLRTKESCRFYQGDERFSWKMGEAKPYARLAEAEAAADTINSLVGPDSPLGVVILPLVITGRYQTPEAALAALQAGRAAK